MERLSAMHVGHDVTDVGVHVYVCVFVCVVGCVFVCYVFVCCVFVYMCAYAVRQMEMEPKKVRNLVCSSITTMFYGQATT